MSDRHRRSRSRSPAERLGRNRACDQQQAEQAARGADNEPHFLAALDHWPAVVRNIILDETLLLWCRVMVWAVSAAIDRLQGQARADFIRQALPCFHPARPELPEAFGAVSLCLMAWQDALTQPDGR
eukprot:s5419_g6.t1